MHLTMARCAATALVLATAPLALGFLPGPRFSAPPRAHRNAALEMGTAAEDMGLPCTDECAIGQYPKMPPSVHPGV